MSLPLPYGTLCQTKAQHSLCRARPLRRFAPALPKGEPLAVRQVFHFILYARLPQKEPSGVVLRLHAFAKASHFGRGGIAQAMTERASPLTAAHRVRLDCTCDGAAYTCDRTDSTCDRANGFIFPHTITYYRPSPPLHPVYGKAITGRGALRGT